MSNTEPPLWEEYGDILSEWLDDEDDRLRVIARTIRDYSEGDEA